METNEVGFRPVKLGPKQRKAFPNGVFIGHPDLNKLAKDYRLLVRKGSKTHQDCPKCSWICLCRRNLAISTHKRECLPNLCCRDCKEAFSRFRRTHQSCPPCSDACKEIATLADEARAKMGVAREELRILSKMVQLQRLFTWKEKQEDQEEIVKRLGRLPTTKKAKKRTLSNNLVRRNSGEI